VPVPTMIANKSARAMITAAINRRGSTEIRSLSFSGWLLAASHAGGLYGRQFIAVVLFLFDIDGTILRGSTAVHREAFAHAYRRVYGLPLSLDGVSAAGRTDTWLLAEPLRRQGMADADIWDRMPQAFDRMQEYVGKRVPDLRPNVLPGIPQVLAELDRRGELLGLLTGNLSGIAAAKMRAAGLARYFEVGGFGEESEIRAHLVPVAIAKAGERAGHPISPSNVVIIGDTPLDIEAGTQAGTRTAGVATGPYSVEDLARAGADLVLESLEDAQGAVEALVRLVGGAADDTPH
jgi:phosphoglycolate phosphatase